MFIMGTRPPAMAPATTPSSSAFTLVEVVIVVLIIGILAAVAVPKLVDTRDDVIASAIMTSLDVIQDQIDAHYQTDGSGNYPATIEASWFTGGKVPKHPQNGAGIPPVQVTNSPGTLHPTSKCLKAGVPGAWWYNSAEGVVRARVSERSSEGATLQFYNRVNDSQEASVGNYTGQQAGGS
jgi:general secretion pathway protein G